MLYITYNLRYVRDAFIVDKTKNINGLTVIDLPIEGTITIQYFDEMR
jgi:hypothetical protein